MSRKLIARQIALAVLGVAAGIAFGLFVAGHHNAMSGSFVVMLAAFAIFALAMRGAT